jgi:hypothetical protein
VIKSVARTKDWNELRRTERHKIAEIWAPVLRWELELGRPRVVVSVGNSADAFLNHLLSRGLIPSLPLRKEVWHYAYVGQKPDVRRQPDGTHLGPAHPQRLAEWSEQFTAVSGALG